MYVMPSKKKRFSRSKRYNPTIRRNKNKLKKIQTGGTKSDIFVETEEGWVPARQYQIMAFTDFIKQYTQGLTHINRAGNFNPENKLVYDVNDIKFDIFGEIYIRTNDGRIMRIKSVIPPEPDYHEEPPTEYGNEYFFTTPKGVNLYFNNTINDRIEAKKIEGKKVFLVDGKYTFYLSPSEIKGHEQDIKNIGVVHINSDSYPLFHRFKSGSVSLRSMAQFL